MLRKWSEKLGPMLEEFGEKMPDLSEYEMPELMPNGDILIRKKPQKRDEIWL